MNFPKGEGLYTARKGDERGPLEDTRGEHPTSTGTEASDKVQGKYLPCTGTRRLRHRLSESARENTHSKFPRGICLAPKVSPGHCAGPTQCKAKEEPWREIRNEISRELREIEIQGGIPVFSVDSHPKSWAVFDAQAHKEENEEKEEQRAHGAGPTSPKSIDVIQVEELRKFEDPYTTRRSEERRIWR